MRNTITIERPDLAIEMVLPVKADAVIPAGVFVVAQTSTGIVEELGYAQKPEDPYGGSFMGIAQEDADATGKANGELTIKVKYPKVLKCKAISPVTSSMLGLWAIANDSYSVWLAENFDDDINGLTKQFFVGKVIGIDYDNDMLVIRTGL